MKLEYFPLTDIEEYNKLSDIEKMRKVVNAFSYCNESFLIRFKVAELMKLYEMLMTCKWDFLPDQWTDRQVKEALNGIVPDWYDNEKPKYSKVYSSLGSKE